MTHTHPSLVAPLAPCEKQPLVTLLCLCLQVQIDPYLEDSVCHLCSSQPGPFFCRDQVRPLGTGAVYRALALS